MMYKKIDEPPLKDGRYLVKFTNISLPEWDCSESAWREYRNGKWEKPFYSHPNDGYELVGWYDESGK